MKSNEKNCSKKNCHESLSTAWESADCINDSRALMFAALNANWCEQHETWHTGHNRKLSRNATDALLTASGRRVALRRECAELTAAAECLTLLAA